MGESYSGIRALADFIRDVTKYQQTFWRCCRGTAVTLSSDSVILVSFSFSFLLPQLPLPMEQLSFPQLSTPRGEFSEPSTSSRPFMISGYELHPRIIAMVRVAEPPELSRLKCIGHHHKGNTGSNALQTEQFLVCQVTSRYNHRFSDRTSIPCTKASPEILQPHVLQHKLSSDYI